ncbi:MAG: RNA-guided pseudouridylation complex pseudouridine synthase subunit Cbf5 [Methanobacteriales archaeon]|nr:RNA-guided pseudouridylation complex pseudouridine synthase subunit Cbf5 [Methanobacteriales archaeon]MBC7117721.1 RNA-guided pseudouridylation complex pseudouridine synthase subunit Cbf5 [Methanobacteriaceae archaeon]
MAKFLIKSKAKTDPAYGCPPDKRPIQEHIKKGVINLDKPPGPTSHQVDSWIRRLLNVKKVGHGGTLDPKVTGILPIGIEKATRVLQLLLEADKEYVCIMRLHKPVKMAELERVFEEFQGKIFQTPPMKAAVKRQLRVRRIYYANILEVDGKDVLFRIGCEAGTYIRKYCHDIGEALGTGAHMLELRRTKVGPFTEDKTLITLHDLTDAYHFWIEDGEEKFLRKCIQPMEFAVTHLPRIVIRDSAVDAICHGANLAVSGIIGLDDNIERGDTVVLMTLKDELVAAGESLCSSLQILDAEKGIVVDTQKVFMERGTYPKVWGKT